MLTASQFAASTGSTLARAEIWLQPMTAAMLEFEIDTKQRQAAFLAQVGHESGGFLWLEELASGAAYDTGKKAISLGNTPEADGDGQKHKGYGPIQLTGFRNQLLTGFALGYDLVADPKQLKDPVIGSRASAHFWWNNKLNRFADVDDFKGLTKAINGGYNGLEDRMTKWKAARKAFGLSPV